MTRVVNAIIEEGCCSSAPIAGLLTSSGARAHEPSPAVQPSAHDRQHDFDFEPGTWTTHHFANRADGSLAPPMIGALSNGRGEFHDQERFDGRAIFVRCVITPRAPDPIRFEQASSADGGRTWEVNWIASTHA